MIKSIRYQAYIIQQGCIPIQAKCKILVKLLIFKKFYSIFIIQNGKDIKNNFNYHFQRNYNLFINPEKFKPI